MSYLLRALAVATFGMARLDDLVVTLRRRRRCHMRWFHSLYNLALRQSFLCTFLKAMKQETFSYNNALGRISIKLRLNFTVINRSRHSFHNPLCTCLPALIRILNDGCDWEYLLLSKEHLFPIY